MRKRFKEKSVKQPGPQPVASMVQPQTAFMIRRRKEGVVKDDQS